MNKDIVWQDVGVMDLGARFSRDVPSQPQVSIVPSDRAWASSDASAVPPSRAPEIDAASASATDFVVAGLERTLQALRDGCQRGSGAAVIVADGVEVFTVDFATQRVWYTGTESLDDRVLGSRLLSYQGDVRLVDRMLTQASIQRLNRRAQSLISMIWDAALDADAHGVTSPLNERTIIHLHRWPGFHLLAHRHDHFRLCSLLLRKPSSARDCAQMLSLGENEVISFARAAYFTGCADLEAPPVDASPDMAPRRSASSRLAGWWRSMREAQRSGS